MIDHAIIHQILNSNLSFPEAVKQLLEAGVERYYTDLCRMEKTLYSHDGSNCHETMVISNVKKIANDFNEEKLKTSLKAIQQNAIDYPTFIQQIADAGVASYTVYITGKQVMYIGRNGEFYIEKFPN